MAEVLVFLARWYVHTFAYLKNLARGPVESVVGSQERGVLHEQDVSEGMMLVSFVSETLKAVENSQANTECKDRALGVRR